MQSRPPRPPAHAVANGPLAAHGEWLTEPQAIAGEMRALVLADAPILVQPLLEPTDGDAALAPWRARIETLDPGTGDFVLGPHGAGGRRIDARFRILCRHGARLTGTYEGVQVEFELASLGGRYDDQIWRLTGRTPKRLHRLQRREAFRVRLGDGAAVLRIHRLDRWASLPVEDVSEGGLRVRIPAAQATPAGGTRWGYCKLELPESAPITCDLQVVHAAVPADGPDGRPAGPRTAGLRFELIESRDAFELRRWIIGHQLREAAARAAAG